MSAESTYHANNSYHNHVHAMDVLVSVWWLVTEYVPCYAQCAPIEVRDEYDDVMVQLMAVLFAAVVHDADHPGVNNQYLITLRNKVRW